MTLIFALLLKISVLSTDSLLVALASAFVTYLYIAFRWPRPIPVN